MMMMMIMIAGLVDSITTPIKSWLDTISDEMNKTAKMTVLTKACGGVVVECIVCLSEVELGERFAMLDRCKHGFHVECVEAWFKHHPNCPLCRTPVFGAANEEQEQRRLHIIIYLNKFVEMTRWCGYRTLETIATWLTKSFSQGLQSTLSESCTYL